ncbi:metallophosphoesterase family protein [candidate division KSB1 bacterium]|nr:metallophosphoesterase family protein [candidate division KSB1 bacterium]
MRIHTGLTLLLIAFAAALAPFSQAAEPELKFNTDGTFKILAISDTHYNANGEPLTDELIVNLIGLEQPDLIIVNGDMTTGNPGPELADLRKSIDHLGRVLAAAEIPWAVTFGNHDCEELPKYGITKADHMGYYEAYPYNVNAGWQRGLSGVGEKNILILDSAGEKPVFNIWLLDSHGDSKIPGARYDWIKIDQISWYDRTSKALETRYGKKIPSLMFFHIPLPEIREMAMTTKTIGMRQEPECPSNINSGMFAAVLHRGDVLGIFHGHDHQNNYVGKWKGILMGYQGVAGFTPYPHVPKDDPSNDHVLGGRVFLLNESEPEKFKTWMRFKGGHRNWETEEYFMYNIK